MVIDEGSGMMFSNCSWEWNYNGFHLLFYFFCAETFWSFFDEAFWSLKHFSHLSQSCTETYLNSSHEPIFPNILIDSEKVTHIRPIDSEKVTHIRASCLKKLLQIVQRSIFLLLKSWWLFIFCMPKKFGWKFWVLVEVQNKSVANILPYLAIQEKMQSKNFL